jgi:hypothetical protein
MVLSSAASLFTGTLATLSSVTINPGATFSAGKLVLSNQVAHRNPCLSNGDEVRCDALFNQPLAPGQAYPAVVTLQNVGTVPAEKLVLWSTACAPATGSGSSDAADLCSVTMLTLHDDEHDFCYYPSNSSGACKLSGAATLADFGSRYGPQTPLALSVDHLGAGIPFTLTIEVTPDADNELQNRGASIDFTWMVSQG